MRVEELIELLKRFDRQDEIEVHSVSEVFELLRVVQAKRGGTRICRLDIR